MLNLRSIAHRAQHYFTFLQVPLLCVQREEPGGSQRESLIFYDLLVPPHLRNSPALYPRSREAGTWKIDKGMDWIQCL